MTQISFYGRGRRQCLLNLSQYSMGYFLQYHPPWWMILSNCESFPIYLNNLQCRSSCNFHPLWWMTPQYFVWKKKSHWFVKQRSTPLCPETEEHLKGEPLTTHSERGHVPPVMGNPTCSRSILSTPYNSHFSSCLLLCLCQWSRFPNILVCAHSFPFLKNQSKKTHKFFLYTSQRQVGRSDRKKISLSAWLQTNHNNLWSQPF